MEMREKKGFFNEAIVRQAQKGFGEKGISGVNAQALIVLTANHFDEELLSIKKSVFAGLAGIWTIAGLIIIGLLLKVI